MVKKAMKKRKTKCVDPVAFTNNGQELTELFDKIHKNNLEKIRNENINCRSKRKRKLSETSIDEIIQKVVDDVENKHTLEEKVNADTSSSEQLDEDVKEYMQWKTTEFDTYNSINRSSVLQSIDILEKILKQKSKKKFKNNCSTLDQMKSAEILWSSSTYIAKYIRLCVLQHNWKSLSYLLSLFLTHSKQYRGYIKEITFLASLVSSEQDSSIMENLERCFVKDNSKVDNRFDIWYVVDKKN